MREVEISEKVPQAGIIGPVVQTMSHLGHILTVFTAIFVIVDPFAVVPVYLMMTDRFPPDAIVRTRRKASWVAMGILSTFAVSGLSIFHIFSITLPAFQIAGGILLLLLGIAQLNGSRTRVKPEEREESMEKEDVSVFPIGTPLLAGPGSISTVVLYSSETQNVLGILSLVISIALAILASYFVLKLAHPLLRILGRTGLNLMTRIMGLILTAVAVQFILNGIHGALQAMHVIS